jgi:hypothetical protein
MISNLVRVVLVYHELRVLAVIKAQPSLKTLKQEVTDILKISDTENYDIWHASSNSLILDPMVLLFNKGDRPDELQIVKKNEILLSSLMTPTITKLKYDENDRLQERAPVPDKSLRFTTEAQAVKPTLGFI